jgi:hypothetical protein
MTQTKAQEAAIDRLTSLRQQVEQIHARAVTLLEKTLEDSASFQVKYPTAQKPFTLTEPSIVELTRARNELAQLLAYYDTQIRTIRFASEQAQQAAQPTQAEQANELALQMRARIEELAQTEVDVATAGATPSVSTDSLPVEEPVAEQAPKQELPTIIPPPENSLMRLIGKQSPLLDLFAPGPWLHEGKGTITVGTNNTAGNFKWYRTINPADKTPLERAKLPTGFFGGEGHPASVVLRMQSCILHWTFGMDHESMSVFMVGLSDADPTNLRWFKVNELSASYTRKLIQELAKVKESITEAS